MDKIVTGHIIVQMTSCIPYGYQIYQFKKKILSREENLASHQLRVLEIMTSQF